MRNVSKGSWSWPAFLRWPAFLIANLVLFLLVGVSTLRESYRGWTVDREIRALEAQAETLEGKKLELLSLTERLSSPEHLDGEARRRMGWKKPGERVVVLTGYESATSVQLQDPEQLPRPIEEPNPQKWLKYFFVHQSKIL